MSGDLRIPAVVVRGGTSRAVLFHGSDLSRFGAAERDAVILAALGSPDPLGREIDGLGGGSSSTSKAALISPSAHPEADVDFNFAQVDMTRPIVDWSGTCGNISAAVGPFAIDEGMVPASEPVTEVRILAVNTGKRLTARVPVEAGRAASEGGFVIDGVPGTGARIELEYIDPAGSLGRGALPTGTRIDELDIGGGGRMEVSMVDVAIPTVFVRASDVGADASAGAGELDGQTGLRGLLERVRCAAAVRLGLCEEAGDAPMAVPKVTVIGPPPGEGDLGNGGVDLLARAVSMGSFHRTCPASVAMATAVAARIGGTLVAEAAGHGDGPVRIGHSAGVMPVACTVTAEGGSWLVPSVTTYRTARRIMEGTVLVPPSRLAWPRPEGSGQA